MTTFFVIAASIVSFISVVAAYRVVVRGNIFDRLLGASAVGTNTIVLMAIVGFIFHRPAMFVDLVIAYSLLNFIGSVAAAKYLEKNPRQPQSDGD